MKILVTGGAGFIGSHLADRFLADGHEVIVIDNFSSGKNEFIFEASKNKKFSVVKADLLKDDVSKYFRGIDEVWHLAANPDVRITDPDIHVKQNFIATKNVLDAMRKNNAKKIFFASSSTVYGEALKNGEKPTTENSPTNPISLYGASKLASEAIIQSYCTTFGMTCWIFRLANVIGSRSTHGILTDLNKKLDKNSKELEILGDGKQKKSYVYVGDCIDAMLFSRKSKETINVFNIGSEDWVDAKTIANMVCKQRKLNPKFNFAGGSRGWVGDVPLMILDINKIKKLGYIPKFNSEKAIKKTLESS